jgi:hypothetical protein
MAGTYEVSPHLLNLNLDGAKGIAKEFALFLCWGTYCGHRRCRRYRWAQASSRLPKMVCLFMLFFYVKLYDSEFKLHGNFEDQLILSDIPAM